MSKWIKFDDRGIKPHAKTRTWHVMGLNDAAFLGEIKWYGQWRQYAFLPNGSTVFEPQCLRDIADFCAHQTAAHRAAKK